jgi:nitrite reductase (NO-forming)
MSAKNPAAGLCLAATVLGSTVAFAQDGAAIFKVECVPCHQEGGVGAPGLAPPLSSPIVANAAKKNAAYVPLVILNGLSGKLKLADGSEITNIMPPFSFRLKDEEIAAVAQYVYGELNGAVFPVKPEDIARQRTEKPTAKDLRAMREAFMP